MNKLISKLLCAAALITSSLGLAHANEVQAAGLTMDFDGSSLTPASQQSNSFTFTFAFPDWAVYEPDGNAFPYIDREVFSFSAQAGYVLTGKMSAQVDATYQLDGSPNAQASLSTSFDVLIPLCDGCGPFDAIYVNSASNYAASTSGPTGSLHVDTGSTATSGSYSHLLVYMVNFPTLSNYFGQIQLNTITFTVDTLQTSPVPELPPAAMLTLGLVLLGARGLSQAKKMP